MDYNEAIKNSFGKYVEERERLKIIGELYNIAEKIYSLGNTDQIFENQTAHLDLEATEMVRHNLRILIKYGSKS